MSNLLPCPFCGGDAERVDIPTVGSELGGDPNAGGSYISCMRCAACSPIHFDRKENLYSSWNDRLSATHRVARADADRLAEAYARITDPDMDVWTGASPAFRQQAMNWLLPALQRSGLDPASIRASIRAAEREACARIAETEEEPDGPCPDEIRLADSGTVAIASVRATKRRIASRIRARTTDGRGE